MILVKLTEIRSGIQSCSLRVLSLGGIIVEDEQFHSLIMIEC